MPGPFTTYDKMNVDQYGNARFVVYRQWYTQPKPYTKPLYFYYFSGRYISGVNSRDAGSWAVPYSYDTHNRLILAVREDLRDKLSESAQLGAAIAEAQSSLDMIASRAEDMIQFVRKFKRGKLPAVGGSRLKSRKPRVHGEVSADKRAASNFLEYHLGWSPMIGDIYSAVDALQQNLPWGNYRSKRSAYNRHYTRTTDHYWSSTEYVTTHEVRVRCRARVSNPNLWLANSLGVINPASVAWEVVPLSFVWDWFQPVGSFLSQLGQFSGLEFENASTTLGLTSLRKEAVWYASDSATVAGFWLERTVGIPYASLPRPGLPQLNALRAATAVSLLTMELKSIGLPPLK